MDDDAQRFAENMVRLRKEEGLSQTALADRMKELGQDHWRQTTVSRIELGMQEPKGGEVRALRAILGPGVLAGTAWAESAKKTKAAMDQFVTVRSLDEIEAQLTAALEIVRELRDAWKD